MKTNLPPVIKLCERLLVDIELAVRRFARFHKYTFGSDLRIQAMNVTRLAYRAWNDREHRGEWIATLVVAVDELKVSLQLGSRIKAFTSFGQFEVLARTALDLGRQVGGWKKQQHPMGQNASHRNAAQRAPILSTHTASIEAKL
jgi:hypothetical protein